jgi:chromosome segregation ATPase
MPPSDRISQLIQRTRSKLEERFAEFEQNLIAEPVAPSEMTSETTTTPPTFAAPELELEIERLTQELNSEREKNSSLSDSLDHLKDNLRAMGREFQNLKEQYERVSHEKSEIEKIAQRTKELPQVEGLMAELQNCHVKFVEYQTQIQKLKSRRQRLARRCISWKKNQNSRQKNRDMFLISHIL